MSLSLNNVIFAGNLTFDPELKALPSGQNVAHFTLAANEIYTKDEEVKETVEFMSIVVFGRQAENCAQYLKKGSSALVEGKLQTRSWEKDGQKFYKTEIVARRVQFGDKPKPEKIANTNVDYPNDDLGDADIPFN